MLSPPGPSSSQAPKGPLTGSRKPFPTRPTNVSLVCYEKYTHLAFYICNEKTLWDVPKKQQIFFSNFGEDFLDYVKKLAAEQILSKKDSNTEVGDIDNVFETESGMQVLAAILEPLPDFECKVAFPSTKMSESWVIPPSTVHITPSHFKDFDPKKELLHWFEDHVVPKLQNLPASNQRVTKIYLACQTLHMEEFKLRMKHIYSEDNPTIYLSLPSKEAKSKKHFNTQVKKTFSKMLANHKLQSEAAAVAANAALMDAEENSDEDETDSSQDNNARLTHVQQSTQGPSNGKPLEYQSAVSETQQDPGTTKVTKREPPLTKLAMEEDVDILARYLADIYPSGTIDSVDTSSTPGSPFSMFCREKKGSTERKVIRRMINRWQRNSRNVHERFLAYVAQQTHEAVKN